MPTTAKSLMSTKLLRAVDGDGQLRERPDSDEADRAACAEQRLFEARFKWLPGTTRSQPVATVGLDDQEISGEIIGVLSRAVVRHHERNRRIAPVTAAPLVARRMVFDDRPLLALTAVTFETNHEVVSALIRIGAVRMLPGSPASLHPALVQRRAQIDEAAIKQFGSADHVIHWGFTGAAIRLLLGIAHEATSAQGYLFETGNGAPIRARIEGDLCDPATREIVRKIAYGELPLPVQITNF